MGEDDERKLPEEQGESRPQRRTSSDHEVEAFLNKVATTSTVRPGGGRGRLIFAMDATASRQPSWDRACHLQAEMFKETKALGGLDVQLVFYRGFGECKASGWMSDSDALLRRMTAVSCLAGQTQIAKVLSHAIKETQNKQVNALVFVGDCMEEDIDRLGQLAGELGLLNVPCFMFHEGPDPVARNAFQQIARLSGGAFAPFDSSSPKQLRDLLSAVAVFAAGGRKALRNYSEKVGGEVLKLTHQMR
ncbi:MAG: VWA domain-containing protein [Rhodovibrionaceae bacterium]|nr:VWA domain-containing protein [Rhodovibrionaceae bacterium]